VTILRPAPSAVRSLPYKAGLPGPRYVLLKTRVALADPIQDLRLRGAHPGRFTRVAAGIGGLELAAWTFPRRTAEERHTEVIYQVVAMFDWVAAASGVFGRVHGR
jgi:hypothetical protein